MKLNNIIESEDLESLDLLPIEGYDKITQEIISYILETRTFSASSIGKNLSIEHAKKYIDLCEGKLLDEIKMGIDVHITKIINLPNNPDVESEVAALFHLKEITDKRIVVDHDNVFVDGKPVAKKIEVDTYPKLTRWIQEFEKNTWVNKSLISRLIFNIEKYYINKNNQM